MSSIPKIGTLQLDQDVGFHRRAWFVQRVGWGVMALIVLAAFLGLAGSGPLTRVDAREADGAFEVVYSRFVRHRAPETIEVKVAGAALDEDELRLHVSRSFLEGISVESVQPEPSSVEVGSDRIVYVFDLVQAGAPVMVEFEVRYDDVGTKRGTVRVEGQRAVTVKQFVYP